MTTSGDSDQLQLGSSTTCGIVDCAIVVVTYNSERHILPFLRSIEAAAGRCTWRVAVVDNASSDSTAACVEQFPQALFVTMGSNLGFAAGINAGRRSIGHFRSLLVANPDVCLGSLAIERLHDAVTSGGHGAGVPQIRAPEGRVVPSLRREPTIARQLGESLLGDHFSRRPGFFSEIVRDPAAYRLPRCVDWATGAVIMVSKVCVEAVGDWDEDYFLFSEEVDYSSRIRDAGFTIGYVPDAHATHEEGGSGRPSPLMNLMVLNRLRYYRSRNSRIQASAYCLALLAGLLLRSSDPDHRRAAVTLLRWMIPGITHNYFPPPDRLVDA